MLLVKICSFVISLGLFLCFIGNVKGRYIRDQGLDILSIFEPEPDPTIFMYKTQTSASDDDDSFPSHIHMETIPSDPSEHFYTVT